MTTESPATGLEIIQEHPEDAPQGWVEVQERLAALSGLSILLVDGRQPPAVVASNNNSICHAFQSSPQHVQLCDAYCGEAHRRAMSARAVTQYQCHAGLQCFTMPIQIGKKRNLAVIGGRAFLSAANYRGLVERLRNGDFKDLLSKEPFGNVIFAVPGKLEELADQLANAAQDYKRESREQKPVERVAVTGTVTSAGDLQQELERLRGELEHRSRFAESVQHFLERISSADPQKPYSPILLISRELLNAERASLLAFDETSNTLTLKAAVGLTTNVEEVSPIRPGEGISGEVLKSGRPLMVGDLEEAGIKPAPRERQYKTKSFISYPITMGSRKIGVLNITDKSGGGRYDDVDLRLLEIIAPQIALALERAAWQEKATEFQLMSITDPLTGLPNRRYLEERLTEELSRSKRYEYAMSFLMIDIDDFKLYNDLNGHQAGDLALKITAHCLKAALRSADVASRYGGEEFCILLPQTSLNEAGVIAERVRHRVERTNYPHGKSQPLGAVTISIGVSTFSNYIDSAEKIIGAADRALYNAKGRGKNLIEFYQDSLTSVAKRNEQRQPR
jgi:diguanylate cyclase (GGDEF)-like protein